MSKIISKPFDWNDEMSGVALEDFKTVQKDLPYCACQSIGTALAKLELLEKQGARVKEKNAIDLSSHSEEEILKECIELMHELVEDFAEWYRWQYGENAIEELDEEERFCVRKTYFEIVQQLFLLHTGHCGGGSTRAKCNSLGIDDWSKDIEFGFECEVEE